MMRERMEGFQLLHLVVHLLRRADAVPVDLLRLQAVDDGLVADAVEQRLLRVEQSLFPQHAQQQAAHLHDFIPRKEMLEVQVPFLRRGFPAPLAATAAASHLRTTA